MLIYKRGHPTFGYLHFKKYFGGILPVQQSLGEIFCYTQGRVGIDFERRMPRIL